MESGYEPFEVVEEDGRTILRTHRMFNERTKVEADKVHIIMDAIAKGWDIKISCADVEGDLDIKVIAEKLDSTEDDKRLIKGNIEMSRCNISGHVNFGSAHFSRNASFSYAHFSGNASFSYAQFSGNADFGHAQFGGYASFRAAQFSGNADFGVAHFNRSANFESAEFSGSAHFAVAQFTRDANFTSAQFTREANFKFAEFSGNAGFKSAHFSGVADFGNVVMTKPADFAEVTFRENHVIKGLWNATLGRIKRWQATDFSGFNTEKVMDGASNPWLKRYIDDELWIQSWRKRSWWREPLFTIWELTSHCGRSIGLWAFWSVLIAVVFAFIYQAFGGDSITFSVDLAGKQPDLRAYIYYSVVTFTTLGFGDIIPKTNWARLAVGAEVVLGYVMLGGLISIFANKLARRS